jgi:hypothetical protein
MGRIASISDDTAKANSPELIAKYEAAIAKMDEAHRAFADALELHRKLARENPQVVVYRLDLMGILSRAAIA